MADILLEPLIAYSRRWIVLIVVTALNIINGAVSLWINIQIWISFAPISNAAANYYNVSVETINWLSIAFFLVSTPFALIASKLSDIKGLKFMIHVGALCNMIGASVRVVGSLEVVPKSYHIYLTMTGQIIAAIGQSFIYIIPSRVSEVWFPDNQRTISTSVIAMGNPMGAAFSSILSPSILNSVDHLGIFYINVFWTVCACIFGLAAFLLIRDSEPPTPPSLSANKFERTQSFGVSVKQMFVNKQYIILFVVVGIGIGVISGIQTLIEQFLCPKGYSSNDFAGLCGGLVSGLGVLGAFISSVIADKTKKLEEISKICLGVGAISLVTLCICLQFANNSPYNHYYIAISFAFFGLFITAAYPIALELAAENTYPVNETLSGGFILMAGQIMSIIYIIVLGSIGGPLKEKDFLIQTCTSTNSTDTSQIQDMTNSTYLVSASLMTAVVIFIIAFKADYKRMQIEQTQIPNKILSKPNHPVFRFTSDEMLWENYQISSSSAPTRSQIIANQIRMDQIRVHNDEISIN